MTALHTINEKGPSVTSTGPLDHTTNGFHYPTSECPRKALVKQKAQFPFSGHAAHDGGSQDFIVVQRDWGHSRHCPDYFALTLIGRQVGVLA